MFLKNQRRLSCFFVDVCRSFVPAERLRTSNHTIINNNYWLNTSIAIAAHASASAKAL